MVRFNQAITRRVRSSSPPPPEPCSHKVTPGVGFYPRRHGAFRAFLARGAENDNAAPRQITATPMRELSPRQRDRSSQLGTWGPE